ncbi:helix-hairpin-helix domain-containing protein [Longimicrobium sp.]|uniref:ComEA family DNA-binding protein n=1 Tax=Longimicrobium sp. TaxID=2029185 RepID=UPI002E327ACB|nr:helix-hairpin-helix domain-containing protein [Longimicrobium sp.]HEX6039793.1 helix-hairpin-helix domain-containing protein [Longimicrobium sp.]
MAATPQERLALGVAALLLAAGAAARVMAGGPAPADLSGPPGAEASAQALVKQVEDSVRRAERRAAPLAPGERIDPNTAPADELDRLPNVGPALARRMVEWRTAHGRFRTMADLDSVPGVGPALLRDAAPHLALRPAPTPPSAPLKPAAKGPSARDSFQSAASVADWERSTRQRDSRGGAAGAVVELNRATAAQLEALPGIGPALARRIVAWRAEHGPFGSVDALAQVPGIGPATVERLRPRVRATP